MSACDTNKTTMPLAIKPAFFEQARRAIRTPDPPDTAHMLASQLRVREHLHKMGELRRFGFWKLLDKKELARFCVSQISKEWEYSADLIKNVQVGGASFPLFWDKKGYLVVRAWSANIALAGIIYLPQVGDYGRTIVPPDILDIALSVRHVVDGLTIIDCKLSTLDIGDHTQSEQQECMLLAILEHPDRFKQHYRVKFVSLATWKAEEYDTYQPPCLEYILPEDE